jgi:hypothetical protein
VSAGVNGLHQDFLTADGSQSRVVAAFSLDPRSPADIDVRGEGTLAAGVAAGRLHGVAKQARIHSVKVFRDDMVSYSTRETDVVRGLQWIVVRFQSRATTPDSFLMGMGCFPCFILQSMQPFQALSLSFELGTRSRRRQLDVQIMRHTATPSLSLVSA